MFVGSRSSSSQARWWKAVSGSMNTTTASIPPHAFLWLRMLICSVRPSVPLPAAAWIQLHQTHSSLCYPRRLCFFFVLVPFFSSSSFFFYLPFLFGRLLSGDAAVVWPNMNREARGWGGIKREEIKTEGLGDTKGDGDEWVMEMENKLNKERVEVQTSPDGLKAFFYFLLFELI